jgi:hypothetical protein
MLRGIFQMKSDEKTTVSDESCSRQPSAGHAYQSGLLAAPSQPALAQVLPTSAAT